MKALFLGAELLLLPPAAQLILLVKVKSCFLGGSSGTNDKNIAKKANKGVGAVSQIFSSLNQISLGHYFYEIALTMRDTILVSKMVSSSEIWYHISKQEYQKLESVDEMFLRRLLAVYQCLSQKKPCIWNLGKFQSKI